MNMPRSADVRRWRKDLAAPRPTKNAEAERLWVRDRRRAEANLAKWGLEAAAEQRKISTGAVKE